MHAPEHICRAVARINPSYRIGWLGRPPEYAGELNPGAFALVHLRPRQVAGTEENPLKTLKGHWDVRPVMNIYGQYEGVERVSRGPLFNARGGSRPDWDPMRVRPTIVQVFDAGLDYSPRDVYSGRFLLIVRAHADKLAKRLRYEDALRRGRDAETRMDDLSREMTDYLWYEANKTGQEWHPSTREEDLTIYNKGRLKALKRGAYNKEKLFLRRMGYER